jgi:hypothetical protein
MGMSATLIEQERQWYSSFRGCDPNSQAQKNAHLQPIMRKQARPTPIATAPQAPTHQQNRQVKEVIIIPSRSPSPASNHVCEKHLSPNGQSVSSHSSPADSNTSPPESVGKREADTDFEEIVRKKARSEEYQAARDAQGEADEREYEGNREAIDAYYLRGANSQIRKASDPSRK